MSAVSALAKCLGQEYLPLLPEALPFVAELLEDTEAPLRAAATRLVLQLEELAGEKLDSYLKA